MVFERDKITFAFPPQRKTPISTIMYQCCSYTNHDPESDGAAYPEVFLRVPLTAREQLAWLRNLSEQPQRLQQTDSLLQKLRGLDLVWKTEQEQYVM